MVEGFEMTTRARAASCHSERSEESAFFALLGTIRWPKSWLRLAHSAPTKTFLSFAAFVVRISVPSLVAAITGNGVSRQWCRSCKDSSRANRKRETMDEECRYCGKQFQDLETVMLHQETDCAERKTVAKKVRISLL